MTQQKVVGIFGGGGFLGHAVVRRLAKKGHLIKVGSRNPESHKDLKTSAAVGQIQLFHADIRDDTSVQNFVDGCDVVINLVGILFEKKKQTFDNLHIKSVERIAKACTHANVDQLIHISALLNHPHKQSKYAMTKESAEDLIKKAFKNVSILRPSLIYGPDDHFFNTFAKIAEISPVLPVFKKGKTLFQPVYVDDVAKAIEVMIDQRIKAQVYELGGPQTYSFEDLLELLLDIKNIKRSIVKCPTFIGWIISLASKALPTPLLTFDQLRMLDIDSVPNKKAKTFETLGIHPRSLEEVLPTYLKKE